MSTLAVYELKPAKMRTAIEQFVGRRPLYQTLALRRAVAEGDAYQGWWYGAVRDGQDIEALMSVVGTSAVLHSLDGDASETLAKSLLKSQAANKSGRSHRHEILGDARSMARFWPTFRAVDRLVVADQQWTLLGAGGDAGPLPSVSKRMKLSVATQADLKLVIEFVGEALLERFGMDPRRSNPSAHATACGERIASGRQLVGREKDKPVFVAEIVDVNADIVQLENIWAPISFRSRKRLIGGAFAAATGMEAAAGKELLVMAKTPAMLAAAERGGFEPRAEYRFVAMVGQ